MSLSSIFVLTITLLVVGSTIFVDQLLTSSLKNLQQKVDMNVHFVPSASQEDIDAIIQAVETLPDVEGVIYTSREEALAEYRENHKNDEISLQALEQLGENPLGADIAIQAKNTTQYENISRFLEEKRAAEQPQSPVIGTINYQDNKESIDTLTVIIDTVERASFIVMIVLIVAAILITFNTIRLAIYTAREEISIMRLVGAGNMYIRGPFMFQGILYGLVAGVLTLLILYPVLVWLGPPTETFFEVNLFNYFIANFSQIFMILVGTGVVLGLVSSMLAIARHLRV